MVKRPTPKTLQRYGLSLEEWETLLAEQGGVCAVCGEEPPSGRLVIDHEHVKDWKHKPPHVRKRYVRGLTCVVDNHFILTKYGTPEKFRRAAEYLERYTLRRDAGGGTIHREKTTDGKESSP